MPILDVDSRAIEVHVARLRTISRSAFPVVVRQTLNKAAMRVKKETMPKEASIFEKRKATFFKANSKVDFAKGFDVNTMEAVVGFKPKPNDRSHSVEDLKQQEDGGDIANRSFIMLKTARVGNQWGKNIRVPNRMSNLGRMIDSKKSKGATKGVQFIQAMVAAGKGGLVIGNKVNSKGNRMLWRVNSLGRGLGNNLHLTPIAVVKKGRKAHVKQTHFMRKASLKSAKSMEMDFVDFANKKIMSLP